MPSECCIQAKPFLVTITGAAGSGKSQLAKSTASELGEHLASRVPTDYFLQPRADTETLDTFFRGPLRYDWDLLRDVLSMPIGTATTTPDVDFERFKRRRSKGGLPLTIRPLMICDAMAPYPEADLIVRLDVPDEVRLARIVERDIRWGTRVQDRQEHLEMTWREAAGTRVDVVLDGTVSLSTNARSLAAIIRESTELSGC